MVAQSSGDIAVAGFAVMLACSLWAVTSYQRMTGITTGRVPAKDNAAFVRGGQVTWWWRAEPAVPDAKRLEARPYRYMEPSLEPCTPGRVVTGRAFPAPEILRGITSRSLSCRSGAADTRQGGVLSAA